MRLPKNEITVSSEMSSRMATFVISTKLGDYYPLEVPTIMGGKELVEMFLDALGGSQG